jgi:hypothetical protein
MPRHFDDKKPPEDLDVTRLWQACWNVQHLLPHPDDVLDEDAPRLREFRRVISNLPPLTPPTEKTPDFHKPATETGFKSFLDACLDGSAKPEDIEQYIKEWHKTDSGTNRSILQYLGMTIQQYAMWVADPSLLPKIIEQHRKYKEGST